MSVRNVWSRDVALTIVEAGETGLTVLSVVCILAAAGLGLLAAFLGQEEGK